MKLTAYEIAMIGVGGAVIGALIGAWLNYKFSLTLTNIIEKRRAVFQLGQAFKKEILALNPTLHALEIDLPTSLENAFGKHREAIFDFSHFLNAKTETRFLQAWYTYYCDENNRNENCVPCFEQYSLHRKTLKEEHEIKKLIRQRINNILEFAKYI